MEQTITGGPTQKPPSHVRANAMRSAVVDRLQRLGYTVDVPPNPLRGVQQDSAYLRDFLSTISGPIVLAGHSYGGTVITNAAAGNRQVKALVYARRSLLRRRPSARPTKPSHGRRQLRTFAHGAAGNYALLRAFT